jgi:hypothetical protein
MPAAAPWLDEAEFAAEQFEKAALRENGRARVDELDEMPISRD